MATPIRSYWFIIVVSLSLYDTEAGTQANGHTQAKQLQEVGEAKIITIYHRDNTVVNRIQRMIQFNAIN